MITDVMIPNVMGIKLSALTRSGMEKWKPHYEVSVRLSHCDWRIISRLAQQLHRELDTTFIEIKDEETGTRLYG